MKFIFGKVVLKSLMDNLLPSSWGWGGYVVQVGRSMSKATFLNLKLAKVLRGGSYKVLLMF